GSHNRGRRRWRCAGGATPPPSRPARRHGCCWRRRPHAGAWRIAPRRRSPTPVDRPSSASRTVGAMLLSAAMMGWPFLFFLSGVSSLIYQVIWVRQFGNLFGNTVFAASLVIAVFMSGLGVGSYVAGVWAERRYIVRPFAAVRAFGYSELAIGALGFALLLGLGRLDDLPAGYTPNAAGWFVPSWTSHAAQYALTILLLGPVTALMGGTLTPLIRHLIQHAMPAAGC